MKLQYLSMAAAGVAASSSQFTEVLTLGLSGLFGVEASVVMAPFVGIFIAASAGAMVVLNRRDRSNSNPIFFFCTLVLTALVLTEGLSRLITAYLPKELEPFWLYPIVAFFLCAGWNSWRSLINWGVETAKKWLTRKVEK